MLWDVKSEILSEFSHKLKLGGYSAKFRQEVIQLAVSVKRYISSPENALEMIKRFIANDWETLNPTESLDITQ